MELRIEHLGFSYRKDRILRDISFYARGGEVTAIIGANAVGKSTLLKCISGILRAQGEILLDGQSVKGMSSTELQHQLEVLDLVRDYTRKKKTATVVTLHELNMAARYADRVVVLKDGMVYKQGIPKDVFSAEMVRLTYQVEAEITADRSGIPVVNPLFSVRTGEKM